MPNFSALKHYGMTNILTKVLMILGLGFWMAFAVSMLVQWVIEYNQRRIWLKEYYDPHVTGYSLQYYQQLWQERYLGDALWDTVAAVAGSMVWLI